MTVTLTNCLFAAVLSAFSLADGDGGFTADYSDIPLLKWMGPEPPDTYQDYIADRETKPFEATLVYAGNPSGIRGTAGKALVLVNNTLLPGIQSKLDIYMADLEYEGYTVELHAISGSNPRDLKTFIISHATDLAGCVFVGDLPVAWYELNVWGHEEFPCDLYFMDLDGNWSDGDSDGLFDGHVAGSGDQGPEIFIGHIDTSMMTGDEALLTGNYLDKIHAYREAAFPVADYALTYTEDDWAGMQGMRTSIKYSYPGFDEIYAPDTNRDDYRDNRIPGTTYEYIQLSCHSSSGGHYFTRGGTLYSHQVKKAVPHAVFYNLFCCSSLRFTVTNFLGGAYIYNDSATSLAVIGSTKSGSMLSFKEYYKPFGAFLSFGEAFRQWFNYLAPYDNDERGWHYGMTIAGDPFLTKRKPTLFLSFHESIPQGNVPPGLSHYMLVKILDGAEHFQPGTAALHYRFSPHDPYAQAALTPLGGDMFEVTLPATKPGDEPEFYYSAQGDKGTVITSPANAPQEAYTFEVCFEQGLFVDDFEADLGWTVENDNVQTGTWERGDPGLTLAQPENDHSPAGTLCQVTGKGGGSPTYDDVAGGPTRLISPAVDLTAGDAEFRFWLWFYHSTTGAFQPLEIHFSSDNGNSWVKAEDVLHNGQWQHFTYRASDHVTPTAQVKIRFSVADNPEDDIVEALLDDFEAVLLIKDPSLWAKGYSIPTSTGGAINFMLEAGAPNANRPYLLLGSLSGTSPGFALPGGKILPLNWDIFTDVVMALLGTPVFQDFMGILDANGSAQAALNAPGPLDPVLIGLEAHFAYLLGAPPGFDFVSNPIPVTFTP